MSKYVIYDIGTEILYETCFVHNSTQKASPEELQVRIVTIFCVDSESNVKTRFSCSSENVHATLDSQVPVFLGFLSPGWRLSYEAYNVNSFLSKSKVPKM